MRQAFTGADLREYIHLNGMILGYVSGGVLYWTHQDHIGRTRMVASQNGDVAWKTTWGPFGKLLTGKTSGTVPTDLRFPGQYWDWESGLAYNGARDYEYVSGRYIQSDPIGLGGGWNTYAYVGGNPVMRVDLLGLDWKAILKTTRGVNAMLLDTYREKYDRWQVMPLIGTTESFLVTEIQVVEANFVGYCVPLRPPYKTSHVSGPTVLKNNRITVVTHYGMETWHYDWGSPWEDGRESQRISCGSDYVDNSVCKIIDYRVKNRSPSGEIFIKLSLPYEKPL